MSGLPNLNDSLETAAAEAKSLHDKFNPPDDHYPAKKPDLYTEYERKYPPDRFGEEASENARVWKVYRDRAKEIDEDMLESWNDILNVLLVFAGLFSAACTAFLIEVYKMLQPDWQQAAAMTTYAIWTSMNGNNGTGTSKMEIQDPTQFKPSSNARWVNGLWFASLTLSLIASLLCILVKQWITEYKSRMRSPASSPHMWTMRHVAYSMGLKKLGMNGFISALPLLLHVALFLFLAGLCVLLQPLDTVVSSLVLAATGAVALFYVLSSLAPIKWGECPTATPALRLVYDLWHTIPVIIATCIHVLALIVLFIPLMLLTIPWGIWNCSTSDDNSSNLSEFLDATYSPIEFVAEFWTSRQQGRLAQAARSRPRFWRYRDVEPIPAFDQARVLRPIDQPWRESAALCWMVRTLPAQEDVLSSLCAIGALPVQSHWDRDHGAYAVNPLLSHDLKRAVCDALDDFVAYRDQGLMTNTTVACLIRSAARQMQTELIADAAGDIWKRCLEQAPSHDLVLALMPEERFITLWASSLAVRERRLHPQETHLLASRLLKTNQSAALPIAITLMVTAKPTPELSELAIIRMASFEGHIKRLGIPWPDWWQRLPNEPCFRFLAILDALLTDPDLLDVPVATRSVLNMAYEQVSAMAATISASEQHSTLREYLRFPAKDSFRQCQMTAAAIEAVGQLTLQSTPIASALESATFFNLLYHYVYHSLPISSMARTWIEDALSLPTEARDVIGHLARHMSLEQALHNSPLSLLKRHTLSDGTHMSAWRLAMSPIRSNHTETTLAGLVFPYTMLLFALHRLGQTEDAQEMLRELLGDDGGLFILTNAPKWRRHIAVHAKVVSAGWWASTEDRLLSTEVQGSWARSDEATGSISFSAALGEEDDCKECAELVDGIVWTAEPEVSHQLLSGIGPSTTASPAPSLRGSNTSMTIQDRSKMHHSVEDMV